MRIIEPHQLRAKPPEIKKKTPLPALILAAIVLSVAGVGYWKVKPINYIAQEISQTINSNKKEAPVSETPQQPVAPRELKTFTNQEFRDMYNTFAYPNTVEINQEVVITGNAAADARIRQLAEKRGYLKRTVPVANLTFVDSYPVQEKVVKPWQELKAAANNEGIDLDIASAFRSPEEQRSLFLNQLYGAGVSANTIAAGRADQAVNQVLVTVAIPGYSRHHNGYTVDFKCNNNESLNFASTACFAWLSKNNYENAKKHGWIPSYPPDVINQGPEPEAWEYVWVGIDALIK